MNHSKGAKGWISALFAPFLVGAGIPAAGPGWAAQTQPPASAIVLQSPTSPPDSPARRYFAQRRQAMLRLVTIGHAISVAAAHDCPGDIAAPGFLFDSPTQYTLDEREPAGLSPTDSRPRIIAVAPASPAARAGLAAGDLLALWPATPPPPTAPGFAANQTAVTAIEQARRQTPAGPVWHLPVSSGGADRTLEFASEPGCGGWFGIMANRHLRASSDFRWIEVSDGLIDRLAGDDDALAFVIAHEMAHRAMRRAGPRDAACDQACEQRADAMALTLVARAGYDPHHALAVLALRASGWLSWLDGSKARLRAIAAMLGSAGAN